MSIEKSQVSYTPTCDVCGETLPSEFDFYDAVNAKKKAGWKSRKVNGDWEDICNSCQADEGSASK